MNADKNAPIVLYLGRGTKKQWITAAVLVALSGFLIFLPATGLRRVFHLTAGACGLVFFGTVLFYILHRKRDHRPLVRVDSEGITDHSSLAAAGLIPWDQITHVKIYPFMNQRFLGIFVKDPQQLLADRPWHVRWMAAGNRRLVPTPFNIAGVLLPITLDELLEQIKRYQAGLLK